MSATALTLQTHMLSNRANGERKVIGALSAIKADWVRYASVVNIPHVDLITMPKIRGVFGLMRVESRKRTPLKDIERPKIDRRPLIRTCMFDGDLDLTQKMGKGRVVNTPLVI